MHYRKKFLDIFAAKWIFREHVLFHTIYIFGFINMKIKFVVLHMVNHLCIYGIKSAFFFTVCDLFDKIFNPFCYIFLEIFLHNTQQATFKCTYFKFYVHACCVYTYMYVHHINAWHIKNQKKWLDLSNWKF